MIKDLTYSKFLTKKTLRTLLTLVIASCIIGITLYSLQQYVDLPLDAFLSSTMLMATPFILGTLGEIYAERSGVTNLGVEGLMAMGAILGVVGAFTTKSPWGGVLFALLGSGGLALIFGIIVVKLEGMQIPAGLGLFMFGLGLSGVIGSRYVGKTLPYDFTQIPIPVLSEIPIVGKFLFSQSPLGYLSLMLVPVMWFILFETKTGLKIRAVGENPAAADSAGIDIFKIRYVCVFIGGALAGVAGSFLSLFSSPGWTEGMSNGLGWLVIALTILSLWGPLRALFWSWLFGGIFVLQYQLQGFGIPVRILRTLPYLLTVIFLSIFLVFSEKAGAPAALLKPYTRE